MDLKQLWSFVISDRTIRANRYGFWKVFRIHELISENQREIQRRLRW